MRKLTVLFITILILIPSTPVYATTLNDEAMSNLNATYHGNPKGTLQDVMNGDLQTKLQNYLKELRSFRGQHEQQTQQVNEASQRSRSIKSSINLLDQFIERQKQSLNGFVFLTYPNFLNLNLVIQSNQQLKTDLVVNLQTQNDLITNLNKEIQQTTDTQNGLQKDINDTKRFIAGQAMEKEWLAAQENNDQTMGKINDPIGLSGTVVDQLLAFSKTFLGSPYVWGGSTPYPGFDCSGYVQYVYNKFGVYLNRVTWDQYQEGQSVAESDLKPGDLVFFTTYALGASHVGIYIGNRMMIDDSDYGVAYDSLDHPYWSAKYIGARRVVN